MGGGVSRPLVAWRARTERRLLLLGLDGAGKSALARAARPRGAAAPPAAGAESSGGFVVETLVARGLTFRLWDVGGAPALRPYWRHYYTGTQGVIFVVDASDGARLALAAAELRGAAGDEQLADAAFAIAVTHSELPGAPTPAEVAVALGAAEALTGHPWAVFAVNAAAGSGLAALWDFMAEKTKRL